MTESKVGHIVTGIVKVELKYSLNIIALLCGS